MKVCSRCKETKFFDMFSKCKSRNDGLRPHCKACVKAYQEANKEKITEYSKAYREANKERITEYSKAYQEANKEKIAEKKKAYYEANKERKAEYFKAYREANKERLAERGKAYYEANKERRKERKKEIRKAYYEANKEKIAEHNKAYREDNKERLKAYREDNKERHAENSSRRRARKRNAIPKFLRNCKVEKKRLQDTYKLRQLISDATGIEHHVDHMWPLSKGGPHWSGNLQILTATENLSKNDKLCKTLKKNIKASLEIARKEYNNEDNCNGHRD